MKKVFITVISFITFITIINSPVKAQANACTDRCLLGGSPNDCPLYGLVAEGTCTQSGRAGVMCKCPAALTGSPVPTSSVTLPPGTTATPSVTPTTSVTPSVSPTLSPNCVCGENNVCNSSCTFNKVTCDAEDANSCPRYSANISCANELLTTQPSQEVRNAYCKRPERFRGDADGDGQVTNIDYLYYVRAVNGGEVAETINTDFNGDGFVSPQDRVIVVKTVGESVVVPTATPTSTTPTPTGATLTTTPTLSPIVSISPTTTSARPTLAQPTLATQQCPSGFSCMTQTECVARKGGPSGMSCGATLFCCSISTQ